MGNPTDGLPTPATAPGVQLPTPPPPAPAAHAGPAAPPAPPDRPAYVILSGAGGTGQPIPGDFAATGGQATIARRDGVTTVTLRRDHGKVETFSVVEQPNANGRFPVGDQLERMNGKDLTFLKGDDNSIGLLSAKAGFGVSFDPNSSPKDDAEMQWMSDELKLKVRSGVEDYLKAFPDGHAAVPAAAPGEDAHRPAYTVRFGADGKGKAIPGDFVLQGDNAIVKRDGPITTVSVRGAGGAMQTLSIVEEPNADGHYPVGEQLARMHGKDLTFAKGGDDGIGFMSDRAGFGVTFDPNSTPKDESEIEWMSDELKAKARDGIDDFLKKQAEARWKEQQHIVATMDPKSVIVDGVVRPPSAAVALAGTVTGVSYNDKAGLTTIAFKDAAGNSREIAFKEPMGRDAAGMPTHHPLQELADELHAHRIDYDRLQFAQDGKGTITWAAGNAIVHEQGEDRADRTQHRLATLEKIRADRADEAAGNKEPGAPALAR